MHKGRWANRLLAVHIIMRSEHEWMRHWELTGRGAPPRNGPLTCHVQRRYSQARMEKQQQSRT